MQVKVNFLITSLGILKDRRRLTTKHIFLILVKMYSICDVQLSFEEKKSPRYLQVDALQSGSSPSFKDETGTDEDLSRKMTS